MDGDIAPLKDIVYLAKKYDALTFVDECHSTGPLGIGAAEFHNVLKDVDIITGTLGKALGGASGGYTTGR
jgi:glycine C-acetyltransferase